MNNSWKRFLSLLLAMVMVLSLGVTGFADEGDAEETPAEIAEENPVSEEGEEAAEGQPLEMQDLDPEDLHVQKLGLEEEEDLGEIVPMDGEDLDTVVRASIFLDAPSTLAAGYGTASVGTNSAAIGYRDGLKAQQDAMTAQIESVIGHPLNVHWNLTLAVNAISADLSLAEMVRVQAIPGVRSVERENQYLPMEDGEIAQPDTANTSEYMVGATAAWSAGYTGAGSKIAIIDTGIDTTHQSFAEEPFTYAVGLAGATGELMTKAQVSALASQLNSKTGNYVSAKIPYGYNYVDSNTTINHINDTEGEHGSHVAGIAAANRFIGSAHNDAAATVNAVGMAPDAQLLVMKVFGSRGGAYDSDYMSAIEDAIVLGADSCNLSLGSSTPGWTFDNSYQEILNNLADPAKNPNMVVAISAGNASDLAYELPQGSLYREDVGMHTGGSPGSYVNSLSVAAAQNVGVTGAPLTFNGSQMVFYTDGAGSMPGIAGSYSYVYIDAFGAAADYSTVNSAESLNGKIVIVNRGELNFAEKGNNATSYKPKAVIVANNQPGTINMSLDDFTGSFPMVSITLADAETIKANGTKHTTGSYTYYTGSVSVSSQIISAVQDERENAFIADFSSWGVPGSLLMKPEITAPGGDIYSVFGTNKTSSGTSGGSDQYELMSGTSMAAPHVAGLSAVLAEYLRENDLTERNSGLSAYSIRAISQSLMMGTATAMAPGGEYLPILQQGAGLANVYDAVNAGFVIMMDPAQSGLTGKTGAASDGKVKVELGDDPARVGDYSFGFTVYNLTDEDVHYSVKTDVFTQALDGDFMSRGTDLLGASTACWWAPIGETVIPNLHDVNKDGRTDEQDADAILDFLTGEKEENALDLTVADLDEDEEISSQDAYLLLGFLSEQEGEVPNGVVPANSSRYCAVRITLPQNEKDYLDEAYPGGAYIEGFTFVTPDSDTKDGASFNEEQSIPILGFYGSWTDSSMFDTVSYVEKLYGSTQESYTGNDPTNYLTLRQRGKSVKFSGNPYTTEESFPADKLAMNSGTTLQSITYNLIRSAGTTGFAVSKLDEEGKITDVTNAAVAGNDVTGIWFYQYQGTWQNTGSKTYSVGKTPASYGLAEGDRFRMGFYAIPEYNAMLVNDSYSASGSGMLNQSGFEAVLKSNTLGNGAMVGYDFVVDDTAPAIESAVLNGNTITVTVSDNEALAYVAVMSLNGSVIYAEAAPGEKTYTLSFDATDAIANAYTYVAAFAGDYAGNESSKALKVNDREGSGADLFVLTSELTAGNEYLILDRSTEGEGHALAFTLNSSATTASTIASAVEVKNDNGKICVNAEDLTADHVIWTAGEGSTADTWTFNNQGWYLRRSNSNGLTITKDTSRRDWTWDGSNNQLTINGRYLRYYNSTFSLNTAVNSVYFFERQSADGYIDPNAVDSVTLDSYSMTLYKGGSATLSAEVMPLTIEDQSVTWESLNTSVVTVDENGVVTAVWTGTGSTTGTIRATSNADSSKYAECTVKVVSVNKTLNAVIWDEEGSVYFSEFNTNNLPNWTKLHTNAQEVPLHSTVYQNSTMYAVSLDSSSSKSYSVSSTYGLSELGSFSYFASDIAPGPTSYASTYGIVVQAYGPYLLVSTVSDLSDEQGNVFGGQTLVDENTMIAGVAAMTLSSTTATYYALDQNGKIWQTSLSYSSTNGFVFSTPKLVVDTGISTDFTYQSLYYDRTYLYWSHQADNLSELIIITPSSGEILHAGNFGDGVWPAAGLFVKNSVAPADEGSFEQVEEPIRADLSFIDSERIDALYMAQFGLAPEEEELPEQEPADEGSIEDGGSIAPVEPILEPVPADDGSANAFVGSLNAFRGYRGAAPTVHAAEPQAADDAIVIDIAERLPSHNGLISVDFDPALVSFVGVEDCESASNLSVHVDEGDDKAVVTIAYANKDADGDDISANAPIVKLSFSVADPDALPCGEIANVITLERNNELTLDEQADAILPGNPGHDWGEPTWNWDEKFESADAIFVCKNDAAHTATVPAEISSETADGVTTYTATVVFQDKTYTDKKIVGEYGEIDENLKFATRSITLQDNLQVNYKVKKSVIDQGNYSDPYVVFKMNGAEVTADGALDAANTYYVFSFRNIAPNKINDTFSATVYATVDGKLVQGVTLNYSICTYCYNQLNKATEKTKLTTLLVDLLNYGTQAQIYTSYNTGNLANAALTGTQASWGTADDPTYATVENTKYETVENPLVSWKALGLYLEDTVSIRLKLAVDDTSGLVITVKDDGGYTWSFDESALKATESEYYFYFSGLTADQMRKTVYITVYKDGVPVSNTVRYSIESYCYKQMTSGSEGLKLLLKAMMKYGDSAYNYAH